MNSDELEPDAVDRQSVPTGKTLIIVEILFLNHYYLETPVEIKDGFFTWDDDEEALTTLKDLNVSIKKGSLVGVVGSVGAGKSSLCSAILGEMKKISGTVTVNVSLLGLFELC